MTIAQPALAPAPSSVVGGYAFALLGVAIWAGWTVVTRMDMRGTMAITDLVALRFATAGLLLLPVLLRRGLPLKRLGVRGVLALAGTAGAPYVLLAGGGHAFAPVSHSGVLICCGVPLATALLARLFLGERFSRPRLIGYGLILAAAAILMLEAVLGAGLGPLVLLGDVMFMAGALLWASYTVLVRHYGLDPLHSTAIVATVSAAFYLPVYALFLDPGIASLSWGTIAIEAGFQGVLTSIVSLLAFSIAIGRIGASGTSALTALVPAAAALLAIPVLDEWPSFVQVIGILTGTLGVALASGAIVPPGQTRP
ncbi:DMT family transporter [Zavarzinia sp.]|uniref:DMT family transporter n=1 Tax=Zavarzinia sp. TaxID=2027920 RepID=UPI003BB5D8A6